MAVRCEGAASGADISPVFPPPRDNPPNMALFDELRRRGFIEGQNLTVEYRAYGQHVDLISQYASELVKARVDVIATAGEEAVRAVQQATKTIPIVAIVGDMLAPRPCENSTRYNRTRNFEACGHAQSKKMQKFLLRSALQSNQIWFSHGLGPKLTCQSR
jgi:hypothetical protein